MLFPTPLPIMLGLSVEGNQNASRWIIANPKSLAVTVQVGLYGSGVKV